MSYVTPSGNPAYFELEKWNSYSSFNGNDMTSSPNGFSQPIWFQIQDNGTNVTFGFSQDGVNYVPLYTTTKASGFLGASGYNNVIFFANPAASQTIGTLMSWTQD